MQAVQDGEEAGVDCEWAAQVVEIAAVQEPHGQIYKFREIATIG